ncbi:MAG: Ig-like domain-containing protein [Treponema sp.]|nr:Ig-like domain-containing protein [Treponema sp.]
MIFVTCEPTSVSNPHVPLTGISISPPRPVMVINRTPQPIQVVLTPPNATDPGITWSITPEDSNVIRLEGTGNTRTIYAQEVGVVTITVRSSSGLQDSSVIRVENSIPVTSITVEPTSITDLQVGTTKSIVVTALPVDATNSVTWSTSDSNIASVSTTGVVTGLRPGSAIIRATSTEDTNLTGTVNVTVIPNANVPPVPVMDISLWVERFTDTNDPTVPIISRFDYPNPLVANPLGTSLNPFNLTNPPHYIVLYRGYTLDIHFAVGPGDATDKVVRVEPLSSGIARVDSQTNTMATIRGMQLGIARFRVYSESDPTVEVFFQIEVRPPERVREISLLRLVRTLSEPNGFPLQAAFAGYTPTGPILMPDRFGLTQAGYLTLGTTPETNTGRVRAHLSEVGGSVPATNLGVTIQVRTINNVPVDNVSVRIIDTHQDLGWVILEVTAASNGGTALHPNRLVKITVTSVDMPSVSTDLFIRVLQSLTSISIPNTVNLTQDAQAEVLATLVPSNADIRTVNGWNWGLYQAGNNTPVYDSHGIQIHEADVNPALLYAQPTAESQDADILRLRATVLDYFSDIPKTSNWTTTIQVSEP